MTREQAAVAVATRSPRASSHRKTDPVAAAPALVIDLSRDGTPPPGSAVLIDQTEAPARSGLTRLLAASFVSFLGDGMLATALPLLAASISRNPVAVGAVVAARTAPWLVFGLLAGVFVDRGDRRMMMVATDIGRGLVIAGLALAVATGHLGVGLLCLLSFVLGTADTVHDCASSAILPAVVEPDGIDRANSLLFTGETISDDLAGRALGGILFAVAVALPFFFDAVSFFGCAVLLMTLTGNFKARADQTGSVAEAGAGAAPRPMQQLREGLQAVVQVPLLRLSMVLTTVVSFGQMMAFSVLVLFVLEKLHLSGSGYGILMAASAVGGILGGFVAPRLIRLYGYAVVLIAAIGFSGVTLGLLAFTSSAIVAGFLIGLQFICLVAGRVVLVGARQRKISRDLLGRVAGAQRTVMWCATAVGALAGGFIGSRFGIRAPIALSGLLFLITAVAAGRAILQHFSEGADSSGS